MNMFYLDIRYDGDKVNASTVSPLVDESFMFLMSGFIDPLVGSVHEKSSGLRENCSITESLSSVSAGVSPLTSGDKAAVDHSGVSGSQNLRMSRPHRFIAGPWAPSWFQTSAPSCFRGVPLIPARRFSDSSLCQQPCPCTPGLLHVK